MRLATIRIVDGTRAVRLDDGKLVDLGFADLGALLAEPDWRARAAAVSETATVYDVEGADFAPVVPHPSKVICVGHNYSNHIKEMGRELPAYPTLFPKFADTLIGAHDDIVKPPETRRSTGRWNSSSSSARRSAAPMTPRPKRRSPASPS